MNEFSCLLCNGGESEQLHETVRDNNSSRVVACLNCELVQLYPLPLTEDLDIFYQKDTQAKEALMPTDKELIWQRTKADSLRRWQMIRPSLVNGNHILEIGSGYGSFLRAVAENKADLDIQITGHEFSAPRRKIASIYADVYSDLHLNDLPENVTYSHVVCYHVLEHVLELSEFISNLKRFCNDNTKIIIEIPNVDDVMLNLSDAYSKYYWQSAHLLYWSPKTIRRYLEQQGMTNIQILGVQRYGKDNHEHWLLENKPQYSPLKLHDSLSCDEQKYRQQLIENLTCDTIYVECAL